MTDRGRFAIIGIPRPVSLRLKEIVLIAFVPGLLLAAPVVLILNDQIFSPQAKSRLLVDETDSLELRKLATSLSAREPITAQGAFMFASPVIHGRGSALRFANTGISISIGSSDRTMSLPQPSVLKNDPRIRVSSEILHTATFVPGQETCLRFTPSVIIGNGQGMDLFVPIISGRTWRDQVALAKIEVCDANGVPCRIIPRDPQPIPFEELVALSPDEERPFSMPAEYDLFIPHPGKYRVTISVGLLDSRSLRAKCFFIASNPLEIEVLPALATTPGKVSP